MPEIKSTFSGQELHTHRPAETGRLHLFLGLLQNGTSCKLRNHRLRAVWAVV
ncbi:hypothetical protein [uncultured Proteiniphilum sp.]|uniref:hypothetical protein n=1 Tax=uncultured Proteiniphilum sp. TaxID=497637 RepID=UPI00262B7E3A|nr:hypothetical protein [uncultured Proteiniphilum sp.]